MKYWLLTTEFPPLHGGGISTYCLHTADMLINNGHEVLVFVNDYGVKDFKETTLANGVRLVRFIPERTKKGKALGYEARLSFEFAEIVKLYLENEGAPDVLEAQDYSGIGYYTQLRKHALEPLFRDLKIVITIHAPGFLYLEYNQVPHYKLPDFWTGEMERASIRMADLAIAPSNYIIDEVSERMDFQDERPTHIFNPYKNNWSEGKVPEYTKGDVCFFGKLTPQKGCLEMFSYFKNLWDAGHQIKLSIIGGGEHFFYPAMEDMGVLIKRKYQEYVDKGFVVFEGNLPPEKLKERLKKAHVVITPSIVDNLPYAVLEAMGLGKVVLGSNNSGHREVIEHGISGFIFEHGDGSFEKILIDILKKDKEDIITIGNEAIKRAQTCTNYQKVYAEKMALISKINSGDKDQFPFIQKIEKQERFAKALNDGFTVVVPYYNMGAYIQETVDSILASNQPLEEIIIVNDGSNDSKSIEKLEEFKEHRKVRIINIKNGGLSNARNVGAKEVKTQHFAFLDADDTVHADYYSRALTVLKQYTNVSFIGCWAQYFEENDELWPTFNPEPPYLLVHNTINSSALVYKTSDYLAFGFNDPKLIYGMEDYDSVIAMVKNGARGVSLPDTLWNYRIRSNSMQQSFNKNKEFFLYRIIGDKHKAFFGKYAAEISHLLNQNGPGIGFDNPTWAVNNESENLFVKENLNPKYIRLIKRIPVARGIAKRVYKKIQGS